MLNVFRENLRHLKLVLILVIVGLVLYLGYYFRSDTSASGGGDWIAKVDGETISGARYRDAARRMDDYYRQMLGDRYEQLRQQLNVGAMTANALVAQHLQVLEARRLGLEATPEEVARTIQTDPRFKDQSGQFIGRDRYREIISRNWPGGIPDFEQRLKEEITAKKWSNLTAEAVGVSEREIEERYRSRANRTKLDYVVVPSAGQKIDTDVSTNELNAYYRAHQDDYKRGEARKIRYAIVDRQAWTEKMDITEADAKAYYDGHQDEFARKEQRRARHILFRVAPTAPEPEKAAARVKAELALSRIQKGEDFGTVAKEMSDDPGSASQGGDLGFFERGRMVPAFEQAAFSTPVGQTTGIVETPFGLHIIQVTETRAEGVQPFDEVKDNLRSQLKLTQAQAKVKEEAERIRGLVTSSAQLDSVAAKEGLKVEEKVVARDDRLPDLQASPQFLEAVFATEPGGVAPMQAVGRGAAIVTVVESLPPAVRPFDEVMSRVRSDVLNTRGRDVARAAARNAFAKSKTLEDAAKALDLQIRPAAEASPGQGLGGSGGVSPELEAALFGPGAKAGDTGVVPVPAGAVLYRLSSVDKFDPAQLAARKEEIRKEILDQRKTEFVSAVTERLRPHHEIEMNYALLGSGQQQ